MACGYMEKKNMKKGFFFKFYFFISFLYLVFLKNRRRVFKIRYGNGFVKLQIPLAAVCFTAGECVYMCQRYRRYFERSPDVISVLSEKFYLPLICDILKYRENNASYLVLFFYFIFYESIPSQIPWWVITGIVCIHIIEFLRFYDKMVLTEEY